MNLLKAGCVLFMLGMVLDSYAQLPTAAAIKKYKVKKVTRQDQGNLSEVGRTEWYYNSQGDDTATYNFGKRTNYKTIEYDEKSRIKTVKEFSDNGTERETTIFTYNPDGSFVSANTDKQYRMSITNHYNSKGLKVKTIIPDGSVHHYEYNAKSQLIRKYAEPKNGGLAFTVTFSYNAKGQMTEQLNIGDYPSKTSYEYNDKGLLKKSIISEGAGSEEPEIRVYLYEYSY